MIARAMGQLRRHRPAVVVVELHVEGPRPFGDRLADAAHAQYAEPLARNVNPKGAVGDHEFHRSSRTMRSPQ